MKTKLIFLFIFILFSISQVSAVIINSIDTPQISPGAEGQIRMEIENILNDDVDDLSIRLNFEGLPFTPIGTSEQSVDEIEEDDEEDFIFLLRASPDAEPKDYEIPYTISYEINSNEKTKSGTIGIRIEADPELTFTLDTTNPIVGMSGEISLKIINRGFFDARFVSVKAIPDGFVVTSDSEEYIGEVESDDFETVNFDVIFSEPNPKFFAVIEYRDFNNKKIIQNIELPLRVYTPEKAIELGLIQPNKTSTYVIAVVILITLFIIWRSLKKRRRKKQRELARAKT